MIRMKLVINLVHCARVRSCNIDPVTSTHRNDDPICTSELKYELLQLLLMTF
jgi:hypothetical protein